MKNYTKPIQLKLDEETMRNLKSRAEKERRKPGQLGRIIIEDAVNVVRKSTKKKKDKTLASEQARV